MHERTTNHNQLKEKQKIYTPKEFVVTERMEKTGNGMEVIEKYQIHPQTLYRWKKVLELGAQTFLSGKRRKSDPRKAIRKRGQEAQGCPGRADKGIDAFKKGDKLALTNRRKGMHLDNFDFLFQPKVGHLASCDFIRHCENVLLSAPPGVGNIHLVVDIGVRAIEMCYSISYFRVEELLLHLKKRSDITVIKQIGE